MFNKKKKILEDIRQNWGKRIDKYRNFDLISSYHDLKSQFEQNEFIDEKTWSDLNLDSLFVILDRTTSNIGQQFLYHLMKKYEKDRNVLTQRYNLFQFFRNNAEIREAMQLKLRGLDDTKTYFISNLIFGDIPAKPKYYYFLYLLPLLTIISFIEFIISLLKLFGS